LFHELFSVRKLNIKSFYSLSSLFVLELDDGPKSYAIKEQLILMLPNTNSVRKKMIFVKISKTYSLENENKEYDTCGLIMNVYKNLGKFDYLEKDRYVFRPF